MSFFTRSALAACLFLGVLPLFKAQAQSQRPPQFVLISFDGSKSFSFWEDSLNFAKEAKRQGKKVDFTYYISGVYFQPQAERRYYKPPHLAAGNSAIGFGETPTEIGRRIGYLNRALGEGHELGSHANGHYNGSSWSYNQWREEFAAFNDLVFGAIDRLKINRIESHRRLSLVLRPNEVIGFRAPQLGVNKSLFQVQKEFNMQYDTSRVRASNTWPYKDEAGIWQIPLASLELAGTAKKTVSMDYNHYFQQSGAARAADRLLPTFQKQVEDTYKNYFLSNYRGNRAPVVIGHHFSLWNNGIYWTALKKFILDVCGLPEVRCVTYREYLNYINNFSTAQLRSFQNTRFQGAPRINLGKTQDALDINLDISTLNNNFARLNFHGEDLGQIDLKNELTILVDGKAQDVSPFINLNQSKVLEVAINNPEGVEIFRKGYNVLKPAANSKSNRLQLVEIPDRALEGDLPEAHHEMCEEHIE